MIGALAGMSSQGITVHEANLEEDEITFNGFPFPLRLRYIMENAQNLQEAQNLWQHTNNTSGFNHMVGSGSDSQSLVMETMRGYTAYFGANDPREAKATWTNSTTKVTYQIGFPMEEAVWRTNHGYDPIIREHFEYSQGPSTWSQERYMQVYDGFKYYENAGIKMDIFDAINVTAIVADKGYHPYYCANYPDGMNVISCTFHPSQNEMYIAWEDGTLNSWRPACCNIYVHFEMSRWWN